MGKLARGLFFLAKTRTAGRLVGSCFAHGSFLIPVKRIYETHSVLAFLHPKPVYPHHVVIVPKKAIPNLLTLSKYPDYATAIHTAAQTIVAASHWEQGTSVLCANGGSRQEVQQVHFHLFHEDSSIDKPLSETSSEPVQSSRAVKTVLYPQSHGRLHLALIVQDGVYVEAKHDPALTSSNSLLALLLPALPPLNTQFHLVQRGYTFLMYDVENSRNSGIGGHIVAGTMGEEAHT